MTTAARAIPFRADPSALRRAGIVALMRTATAHLVAKVDGDNPDQIAKKNWPDDRDVGLLIKGAVSMTTTTSAATILTTADAGLYRVAQPDVGRRCIAGAGPAATFRRRRNDQRSGVYCRRRELWFCPPRASRSCSPITGQAAPA